MLVVALVQCRQKKDVDDNELSDPTAATYENHVSDIVDILTDLLDKTQCRAWRHSPRRDEPEFGRIHRSISLLVFFFLMAVDTVLHSVPIARLASGARTIRRTDSLFTGS